MRGNTDAIVSGACCLAFVDDDDVDVRFAFKLSDLIP